MLWPPTLVSPECSRLGLPGCGAKGGASRGSCVAAYGLDDGLILLTITASDLPRLAVRTFVTTGRVLAVERWKIEDSGWFTSSLGKGISLSPAPPI